MKKFQTISATEAHTMIGQAQPMILDCRELKDYRRSHITGALHVHEGLKESLVKSKDKQQILLIYCYYGHASEHLAEFFCDFGFRSVYSLAGGYASWQEQQVV